MNPAIYLGFDPGGKSNFGWARLRIGPTWDSACLEDFGVADCAAEAMKAAIAQDTPVPAAAGIDAPLFYAQLQPYRKSDQALRERLKSSQHATHSVISVNSLRGACLIQGLLLAISLRDTWKTLPITEVHPKILERLDNQAELRVESICSDPRIVRLDKKSSAHVKDAIMAAYAAWAGQTKQDGWGDDLLVLEDSSYRVISGELHYWFPRSS